MGPQNKLTSKCRHRGTSLHRGFRLHRCTKQHRGKRNRLPGMIHPLAIKRHQGIHRHKDTNPTLVKRNSIFPGTKRLQGNNTPLEISYRPDKSFHQGTSNILPDTRRPLATSVPPGTSPLYPGINLSADTSPLFPGTKPPQLVTRGHPETSNLLSDRLSSSSQSRGHRKTILGTTLNTDHTRKQALTIHRQTRIKGFPINRWRSRGLPATNRNQL